MPRRGRLSNIDFASFGTRECSWPGSSPPVSTRGPTSNVWPSMTKRSSTTCSLDGGVSPRSSFQLVCPDLKFPSRPATQEDRGQDLIGPRLWPAGGGGENRTRVRSSVPQDIYERTPGLHLACQAPVEADPDKPVAELSPPDGRDARRERVSGVYAGRRSC